MADSKFGSLYGRATSGHIGIQDYVPGDNNVDSGAVSSTSSKAQVGDAVPSEFALRQNYPNPFNPSTRIHFDVPHESLVSLEVFDVTGRLLRVLTNRTYQAGSYSVPFEAAQLPSGIYLYQLSTPEVALNRRMLLLQ